MQAASLDEAESIALATVGRSELRYERQKAATIAGHAAATIAVADLTDRHALATRAESALARGATLTTFRRLLEVSGYPRYDPVMARTLAGPAAHDTLPVVFLELLLSRQARIGAAR
jgi:hypothetical protein